LKRWISSTKTIVRRPVRRRDPARRHDLLDLLDAGQHGAERDEMRLVISAMTRASVVLPVPGGPHRMMRLQQVALDRFAQRLAWREDLFLATISSSVRGRMRSASGVPVAGGDPPLGSRRRRANS
jgi:hypothetical protein